MTLTTDLCDKLDIPWQRVRSWDGPVWDGEQFFFADNELEDPGDFHELMHWIVADEWQKECPDFALGKNAVASYHAQWSSSRWKAPAEDASRFRNAGSVGSWSNEPRVRKVDARDQENLASFAIALYALYNPKEKENVISVMNDFSCWANWGQNTWNRSHNEGIVKWIVPVLGLNAETSFKHLEKFRLFDPDDFDY